MGNEAIVYVHPNRKGVPKFWSYFKPATGLNLDDVQIFYGEVEAQADKFNVQTKDRSYDLNKAINTRVSNGYQQLAPLHVDSLEELKPVVLAWQAALIRREAAVLSPGNDPTFFDFARVGLMKLGGNPKLIFNVNDPLPKLKRLKVVTTKTRSAYDW